MWWHAACDALNSGKRLEVRYDGYIRIVEVHAAGESSKGDELMRVWQVRGGSVSNERMGWKLLRLDETTSLGIVDEASEAPRQGYRRGDSAMDIIRCQI